MKWPFSMSREIDSFTQKNAIHKSMQKYDVTLQKVLNYLTL